MPSSAAAAALLLVTVVAEGAAAEGASAVTFGYDHGSMVVALAAGGDVARVTYTPKVANASFLRYQGYINQSALATAECFTVTKAATHTILARAGWSLNVSHAAPMAALSVGGVVVSRDVSPPIRGVGPAACDPPKWRGLPCVNDPANGKNCRSGIGTTVATDNGGCLVGARSLASSTSSHSAGVRDEHIFGFGQTVTPGLNAVGSTKFIATFSRTLSTGPSHAPAPSYISLASDVATNKSLAHGFFLNTHGYSAFDVGATIPGQLGISSPDPIFDYFLFAGPTPAAVIGQFANVAGGRMSLPPKWAMGMKYDPRENGDNQTFVPEVLRQFADRGIRPDRAILEPAWQDPQYNWDPKKFSNVSSLIEDMAPTKLILWEHPILDISAADCASIITADGKRVCVKSDGYKIRCCPAPDHDGHKCADCSGGASLGSALVAANCTATDAGEPQQYVRARGQLTTGVPKPTQFSDLTLPKCQAIWKEYQLTHAIASGAEGFKLDEDDVDVSVGFNDSTVFPSGMMGYQFHNLEGYIWQRMYHEMFESLGKRTWLQSRGGYAGSQAYPTNSYSDGYIYNTYVIGVVNSGFSGLIWAPEMRHATCTSNHTAAQHADFARRTQLMFLSPQAQYNAWDGHDGCTLWDYGDKGGLPCGPEYLEMFKKHYDLRTGLQLYLYSAFETQSRTGLPLARPLVLDSPDERATWTIDDQFMLGDALMFPPAGMAGPESTNRTVYFPRTAKSWHSWFHNATSYRPGQSVEVETPIMTAPLFVKGGVPVVYKQRQQAEDTLELTVWMPHTEATDCVGESEPELTWSGVYDDDGESTRYKTHGEHWRGHAGFGATRCTAGGTGARLSLRFTVSHASYVVPHERVEWTVRELPGAVAGVECVASDGAALAGEVEWTHSVVHAELRVSTALGHSCTVHLL